MIRILEKNQQQFQFTYSSDCSEEPVTITATSKLAYWYQFVEISRNYIVWNYEQYCLEFTKINKAHLPKGIVDACSKYPVLDIWAFTKMFAYTKFPFKMEKAEDTETLKKYVDNIYRTTQNIDKAKLAIEVIINTKH